ncbi:MAG: type IV pilin [ANME-2 cluster archaeon]|nr:type IV pilin [ANME-2 cluster archaeon]
MRNVKDEELWKNQMAVSEVIGEVLMVAVAVVAFAILNTMIFSFNSPNNPPA